MSSPTPEPGDVIARNDVTRPTFTDLASGDLAPGWLKGTGTGIHRVGGSDRFGSPLPDGSINTEQSTTFAASTALGPRTAGDVLHVWLDYQTSSTADGASVELITDRSVPFQAIGPARVLLPAGARSVQQTALTVPADGDYLMRLSAAKASGSAAMAIFGVRADVATDDLGIFSGATPDTEDIAYDWLGETFASVSIAADPTPPGPPPAPTLAALVARLLGTPDNAQVIAQAEQTSEVVAAMAREYTRGRGFTGDTQTEGIRAVIVTATARLMGNPEQVDHGLGSDWTRGSFSGWTLAEQYVLNGYRRRAQ